MQQLFLSRRNLLTLLNKLNRAKQGESTHCTIVKCDTVHRKYASTVPFAVTALEDDVTVTAVEDGDYYEDRPAGDVHPADEPR